MSAMSAGCSLRQPFVGDLQLDAPRRVGLEQIDELPRDDARRNLLEQRAQRERRHDALAEAADRAAGADVHRDDVQHHVAVERRRVELDVVDADDLPAVDVDDLLVEEVALEQQHAVRRRVALPLRPRRSPARTVAPARLQRRLGGSTRSPSAVRTIRNATRVGWSCGATATSRTRPDGAAGIAHGGAEQFRQGDDGHGRRSPGKAISDRTSITGFLRSERREHGHDVQLAVGVVDAALEAAGPLVVDDDADRACVFTRPPVVARHERVKDREPRQSRPATRTVQTSFVDMRSSPRPP